VILPRSEFRYFSLVAADPTVKGVTVEGGKYPLRNARLHRTFQYAVSNEIVGNCALVEVKKGGLWVIESRD
jgi:thiamine pyrophosphokinase